MKLNKEFENLAAIDIGTNSFHLIVVKADKDGKFEIIDRDKEVIRLGEGSTGDIKKIQQAAMERAVACLKRFKGIADSHNAQLRAVATSAVRESFNKNEFIFRVFKETEIDVEVVSGAEEARLIYLGVLKAVPIYDKQSLVVDIGGGSTEFVFGKYGEIDYSRSIKIGAVRLTQKYFPDLIVTKKGIKECRQWVEGEIAQVVKEGKKYNTEIAVGSSGTIMACASMIEADRRESTPNSKDLNNYVFKADELFALEKKILSLKTVEERIAVKGLDEKRVDIIPAGIIIISTIMRDLGLNVMTISNYALREGIIVDTLNKLIPDKEKPGLQNIREESIRKLVESCNFDKDHCEHVANLALQIFDQTKELHNLNSEEREYLFAAARLHDIGYHISHAKHHKHSAYIILNSELLGFNETEKGIIANTARYHRKSHPKKSHEDYVMLHGTARKVVNKLSAILRIADSLDRTHGKIVKDISVNTNGKIVKLKLITNGCDPEIELWNLNRRKMLFEEEFGKELKISF